MKKKFIVLIILIVIIGTAGWLIFYDPNMKENVTSRKELIYDDVKVEPVDAKKLLEQYGIVMKEYRMENAENLLSEKKAIELFVAKGFVQFEAVTEYNKDGDWIGEQIISNSNDIKHPVFYTYFIDEKGQLWKIVLMENRVYAYMIQSKDEKLNGLIITENKSLLSYDNATKTFFEFEPNADVYTLEKEMLITADTLNNYIAGE